MEKEITGVLMGENYSEKNILAWKTMFLLNWIHLTRRNGCVNTFYSFDAQYTGSKMEN